MKKIKIDFFYGQLGLKIISTYLGVLFYILVAAVILKLTICMKPETDWGIAAA